MEAGLGSESDYAVFLLVDVKDEDGTRHIFHNTQDYDKALEELVPREFRDMAVLFDQKLLESWYPEIPEHSVFFQAYQPLQLFAQLFSGFDHYWQIELDSKITGDSRIFLDALSNFARKEPRKQSIERSSYYYMPQGHGCYEEFRSRINDSLKGGGFWGPVTIPDIPHPIGPEPPFQTPEEDLDFTWGVDEDADLILTNGFASIPATSYWPFKNWLSGFKLGTATPRFYSPVAMGRYSWNLLNTIHHAQVHQALALPSEATPLSFALYHGLKVVFPPHPWFHHPQDQNAHLTIQDLNNLFNGNTTMLKNAKINNGLSFGKAMYDPDGVYELFNGATWWWVPGFPGEVMKAWMRQDLEIEIENEMNDGGGEGSQKGLASVLRVVDGEVWAPIMALHPVKSWDFE